jgi:two-component system osmolarity sensor histidine kinase EnvZ
VRLTPRTLLWRTFLLVAVLMLLSVLAWYFIYSIYARQPRAEQTAQMVASVVNLTRAALVTAQPDKRRDLLMELSYREGIQIWPAEDGEAVTPLPDDPLLELVLAEVRGRIGPGTRIVLGREGVPGLWVSFAIEDDDYWVRLPPERLESVIPRHWIGWAAAAFVLSLLGAYLIVFGVTRPLKSLAAAAGAIGQGRFPEPLAEAGAQELATLARAFNRMSADLQQLEADRALILAGVSHDLRTPLARLRLGVELSGADEATREGMNEDIEDMDKVIGQFLDFARESSGEGWVPTDLNALAAEVAESYRKRGATVEARVQPLPELPARPTALRRVLANLIDNALRYAGQDAPVELHTAAAKGQAILEVRDRGPGIPADQVERLKRPFTRLDTARSNASGAGLGLAIVDRIVRGHGGRLDLLPRPGGGLIARIALPLAAPQNSARTPASAQPMDNDR